MAKNTVTDAEYKESKEKIQKYLDKWMGPGGFNWWRIEIEWVRESQASAAADTVVHWQYRQVYIKFYLPIFEDMPEDRIEQIVVHELSHILIGSVHNFSSEDSTEITEYATENVARALLFANSTVERGKKDA